jgi:hypothetical protein
MDIRGVGGHDLDGFYRDFGHDKVDLTGMLEVLRLLRGTPWKGVVYGLNSHAALVLLKEDTHATTRWVTVDPWRRSGYEVRYYLPESEAPWTGAQCGGIATTPAEAAEMAVLGMKLCGAWNAPTHS